MLDSVHRPFRLAILECDTHIPANAAKYGRYGQVSASLLLASGKALDVPEERFDVSFWHVINDQEETTEAEIEYPEPDQIDGIWVTGSRKSSLSYVKSFFIY